MNKIIEEEIEKLEKLIEKAKSWEKDANFAEGMKEKFECVSTVNVGVQSGQVHGVLVYCYPEKMGDVTEVLKHLSKAGYRIKGKPSDYEEMGRRVWDLGVVQVMAFFSSGKSKCTFKKVGEKTEPVYELVCE